MDITTDLVIGGLIGYALFVGALLWVLKGVK